MLRSRALPLLASAALLAAVVATSAVAEAKVNEGDRAAEISAKDARGRKVALRSLRGKIVVVTFGASWCKPCKKELPAYDKLARRWKDKGVVFVAINIDSDKAKGKKFMKRLGIDHMKVAYDPSGSSAETYGPPTMPSTYVIGKRGVVRKLHAGYRSGDDRKLAKILKKLTK